MGNLTGKIVGTLTTILIVATLGACGGGDEELSTTQTTTRPPPAQAANNPPSIAGDPVTMIAVDEDYLFLPTASDADGDAKSFSIQNPPNWASFDAATGSLSGTPKAGDVGTYPEIIISVSDGDLSASLATFAIDVVSIGTSSITLSWTPPTQNSDGSALTDLAGYNIYYGLSAGSYANTINVDNPGIATLVVENLTPNTYYFVATAINQSGVESDYSNIAVKTVF